MNKARWAAEAASSSRLGNDEAASVLEEELQESKERAAALEAELAAAREQQERGNAELARTQAQLQDARDKLLHAQGVERNLLKQLEPDSGTSGPGPRARHPPRRSGAPPRRPDQGWPDEGY